MWTPHGHEGSGGDDWGHGMPTFVDITKTVIERHPLYLSSYMGGLIVPRGPCTPNEWFGVEHGIVRGSLGRNNVWNFVYSSQPKKQVFVLGGGSVGNV